MLPRLLLQSCGDEKRSYIHDNGRAGSNLDHGLYLCGVNEIVVNNILFRNASSGLQIAGWRCIGGAVKVRPHRS